MSELKACYYVNGDCCPFGKTEGHCSYSGECLYQIRDRLPPHPVPRRAAQGEALPPFEEMLLRIDESGAGTADPVQRASLRVMYDAIGARLTTAPDKTGPPPCGVCGGPMVTIRGPHPKAPRRTVCPTCMVELVEGLTHHGAFGAMDCGMIAAQPPDAGEGE